MDPTRFWHTNFLQLCGLLHCILSEFGYLQNMTNFVPDSGLTKISPRYVDHRKCYQQSTDDSRRRRQFITLSVQLCVQRDGRDTRQLRILSVSRRVSPSGTPYFTALWAWLPGDGSVHYPAPCSCSLNHTAAGQQTADVIAGRN